MIILIIFYDNDDDDDDGSNDDDDDQTMLASGPMLEVDWSAAIPPHFIHSPAFPIECTMSYKCTSQVYTFGCSVLI